MNFRTRTETRAAFLRCYNRCSGPWFELWSRLCHQGTIYTASYAAVPVITEAIKHAEGPIAMDFVLLPASIELARDAGNGPALPAELEADYHAAIADLGGVGSKYTEVPDAYVREAARAAQLIGLGRVDEARELIDA